jgi:hypothetical protein
MRYDYEDRAADQARREVRVAKQAAAPPPKRWGWALPLLDWAQAQAGWQNQDAARAAAMIRAGRPIGSLLAAAFYPGARAWVCRRLRQLGGRRVRKSGSGSVCYLMPDGRRVRVSGPGHRLPLPREREHNRSQGIEGLEEIVLDHLLEVAEIEELIRAAVG